jgi:hypothetical protein
MSLAQNYSEEFVQGKDTLVALDTTIPSSAISRNSKPGAQLEFLQVASDLRVQDEDDDDDEEALRSNTAIENGELW